MALFRVDTLIIRVGRLVVKGIRKSVIKKKQNDQRKPTYLVWIYDKFGFNEPANQLDDGMWETDAVEFVRVLPSFRKTVCTFQNDS